MGLSTVFGVGAQVITAGIECARRATILTVNPNKAFNPITSKATLHASVVENTTEHLLRPGITSIHEAGDELGKIGKLKNLFKEGGLEKLATVAQKLRGRGALICGVIGLLSAVGGKLAWDTVANSSHNIAMIRHGHIVDSSNSQSLWLTQGIMGGLQGIGCLMVLSLSPALIPLGIGTAITAAGVNAGIGLYKKLRYGVNLINNPESSTIPYLGELLMHMTGRS